MPPHNCLYQPFSSEHTIAQLQAAAQKVLAAIEGVTWTLDMQGDGGEQGSAITDTEGEKETRMRMVVRAAQNTWSRSARRKKKAAMMEEDEQSAKPSLIQGQKQAAVPVLRCRIQWLDNVEELEMVYTWMEGDDRGVFESFTSHVNRKVGALLAGG